ncbi:MAG: hypothetical protein QHH27_06285 [Clostridia bacterium]|nr:hypothetical protein [Clostridia bacterium]MDH7573143.1 hypothetical protein [Clostridia bacterium]
MQELVEERFPGLLYALALQDFPESLVMTLVVLSFLNYRLLRPRTFYIALLQTATNLVRLLPVVHTVVLVVSLALYTWAFTRARMARVLYAVLLCFAITIGTEFLYLKPLLSVTKMTYQEVFVNPFYRALFAAPYEAVLLAVALAVNAYNRRRGTLVP